MKSVGLVYNVNNPMPTLQMDLPIMDGSGGLVVSPGFGIWIIVVSGLGPSNIDENN